MQLHELRPPDGARRKPRRVGRGQGSGRGKTCGRGHKGYYARSGSKRKGAFEGGQTPFVRRVPKSGFNNPCRGEYEVVNVEALGAKFQAGATVDPEAMRAAGLLKRNLPVKVLGDGELSVGLTVRANAFSRTAVEKIEAAGGKAEVLG